MNTLKDQAINIVAFSDFRDFFPISIRQTLVKAALTPTDEVPLYAHHRVSVAIRVAWAIEHKLGKQADAEAPRVYVGRGSISQRNPRKEG